jgi:hypothetical protein
VRTIRIPVHMIEAMKQLARTSRQMLHEIGREPTPEELADKLAMPLEKVRKVLKIAKEPISLETPIGDEEDSHLGDFIEDKNAVLPVDAAIQANLRETTTRVLASLTAREERVLRMRFGIGMNTDHTLEEVVVTAGIGPKLGLRRRLRRFPQPVSPHVQPAPAVPQVHPALLHPQPPRARPAVPAARRRPRLHRCQDGLWRQPHRCAEDFVGCGLRAAHVEEAVGHAPVAAKGERVMIPRGGELQARSVQFLWLV